VASRTYASVNSMALPPTVRVKLSSEAAESIAMTPVVVQELPIRELIGHMLAITGKDPARMKEILLRGTLVSGASRFRWAGWSADDDALSEILATFPDPDPARTFDSSRCARLVLRGGRQPIEIPREAAARKGVFQRETFWDVLMRIVPAAPLAYAGYSYRDGADRFTRDLTVEESNRLRAAAAALKYSTLRDQLHTVAFTSVEVFATR
jgi:hypothetical protein